MTEVGTAGPSRSVPRVVVVGAGFGGLWAARGLARLPCDVVLVDHHNFHTFPALLYQVAAAELQAEDIAYPLRSILWRLPNVRFALARAERVDPGRRVVVTDGPEFPYDYLVLATGSVPHSFGVPGVEEHAFFLKTLEHGVALRNHLVCSFERAVYEPTPERRERHLTFTIVGAGPTGVEYAGALAELVHGPLERDYGSLDFGRVRIVLLEAGATLLPGMPERVSRYALQRLGRRGVEVRLGTPVDRVTDEGVHLQGGEFLATGTVVWTAGVRGEPLARASGLPTGADGRVTVLPSLQVPGHPEVYVVGDLARIERGGRPLPMVAQVAIQTGTTAARNVGRQIAGGEPGPFAYDDKGVLVAIGRNAAGAVIRGRAYTGFHAWLLWLGVHLYKLIGFRNRLLVLVNWAWDYSVYQRAARLVFPSPAGASGAACGPVPGTAPPPTADAPEPES